MLCQSMRCPVFTPLTSTGIGTWAAFEDCGRDIRKQSSNGSEVPPWIRITPFGRDNERVSCSSKDARPIRFSPTDKRSGPPAHAPPKQVVRRFVVGPRVSSSTDNQSSSGLRHALIAARKGAVSVEKPPFNGCQPLFKSPRKNDQGPQAAGIANGLQ